MRDITRLGEEPARDRDRVPRVAESRDQVGKIPPRAPEPDSADAEPAPPAEPAAGPTTSSSSSSSSSAAPRPVPRKAADEQTRERVYANRDKHRSAPVRGPTETGEETLTQEWTAFDLGHALKL